MINVPHFVNVATAKILQISLINTIFLFLTRLALASHTQILLRCHLFFLKQFLHDQKNVLIK